MHLALVGWVERLIERIAKAIVFKFFSSAKHNAFKSLVNPAANHDDTNANTDGERAFCQPEIHLKVLSSFWG